MTFSHRCWIAGLLILLAVTSKAFSQTVPANSFAASNSVPSSVYPLKAKGISNFFQLSPRIYSGCVPDGEKAFAELKQLGIKTIIAVDGARPDTNTASRFGIRSVHLPFGYGGVPTNQALRLVKAAQTIPGPIFVDCKHGLNRGPTAAAIICMGTEGWTSDDALAWLKLAGTSPQYSGLYKSVIWFKVPSAETMAGVSDYFISHAGPDALRDKMVEIDEHFNNLELIKKANYTAPTDKPTLNPEQEAAVLNDLFTELEHSPSVTNRSEEFLHYLHRTRTFTGTLHDLLVASPQSNKVQPKLLELRDDVMQDVRESCTDCHMDFRNQ